MGQKLGNCLTNREHAPNRYISFIIASIYWRTENPCVIRRDGPNQIKIREILILNYWRTELVSYPLMTQGVVVPSIYWRGDDLYVKRKIHRNGCAWLGDTDRHSVRLPYLLKNHLVFVPYRPEKEICVLNENCKFRFQINLDRHSRRPTWKIFHLPDPPLFSLFSTFKGFVANPGEWSYMEL